MTAANGALDELLDLFSSNEQTEKASVNNGVEEVQTLKVDNSIKKKESVNLDAANMSSKINPSRQLIPINFDCSQNVSKNDQKEGPASVSSLLHSGMTSSSEDESNRSPYHTISLSATGKSIKKTLKNAQNNFSNSYNITESIKRRKLSLVEKRNSLQEKAQQITQAVRSLSKNSSQIFDSFFNIRVRNPLLSSAAFESYCDGLRKVRLNQLKLLTQQDCNWISLAVIVEKTGCRKSANGNEYMVWNVSDLVNSQNEIIKILVFGDCIKKFWKLQLGSVIALITPPFAESNNKQARKFTANRGSFASVLANPTRKPVIQNPNLFVSDMTTSSRVSEGPVNLSKITESRKSVKQLKNVRSSIQAKNVKESEKMALSALLEKKKENKKSEHSPVLGKGLNSNSVLLKSPMKASRLSISEDAKLKAVAVIKNKGGLEKADPNSFTSKLRKKCLPHSSSCKENSETKKSSAIENKSSPNVANSSQKVIYTQDEISALLQKKSNHEDDLRREDNGRDELYFHVMEQKEKVENHLTSIKEIKNCNLIVCTECNYKSHKQSDLCKQLGHVVKYGKANKRFFRCKHCHKRTVSYDRLPSVPCSQCGDNNFERVGMRDERKVKLPHEKLLLRGEELKYVNR
ncbi:unnamed protein product [Thelazia callipaeda]|uniref:Mcm10 domain-containing protein n=1 Tax=Thelazia callipaeda TaxID=103827 RepID=A0A158RD34_THECL|nr:unnamed protein product [Thelazia callipaeda]